MILEFVMAMNLISQSVSTELVDTDLGLKIELLAQNKYYNHGDKPPPPPKKYKKKKKKKKKKKHPQLPPPPPKNAHAKDAYGRPLPPPDGKYPPPPQKHFR